MKTLRDCLAILGAMFLIWALYALYVAAGGVHLLGGH